MAGRVSEHKCPDCNGPCWDETKSDYYKPGKSPIAKCKDKDCGGKVWAPREKQNGGASPEPPAVHPITFEELTARYGESMKYIVDAIVPAVHKRGIQGRVPNRGAMRSLKEYFLRIGEPCDRQPQVFHDIRADQTESRMSWAKPVLYSLQAMASASTPAQKRAVLEGVTRFALEMVAICRAECAPLSMTLAEAVQRAQAADASEEMAESAYLAERTPANLDRWRVALRDQFITSSELDMVLYAEARSKDAAPLRLA